MVRIMINITYFCGLRRTDQAITSISNTLLLQCLLSGRCIHQSIERKSSIYFTDSKVLYRTRCLFIGFFDQEIRSPRAAALSVRRYLVRNLTINPLEHVSFSNVIAFKALDGGNNLHEEGPPSQVPAAYVQEI